MKKAEILKAIKLSEKEIAEWRNFRKNLHERLKTLSLQKRKRNGT